MRRVEEPMEIRVDLEGLIFTQLLFAHQGDFMREEGVGMGMRNKDARTCTADGKCNYADATHAAN